MSPQLFLIRTAQLGVAVAAVAVIIGVLVTAEGVVGTICVGRRMWKRVTR